VVANTPDLLLRPADKHHPLGPPGGQKRRQVLAHHLVLALPGGELNERDTLLAGEPADLRVERLGLPQHVGS
jgi:hypothetical protein